MQFFSLKKKKKIQENQQKCERISNKIKTENNYQEGCKQNINKFEKQLQYLINIERKLIKLVELLAPYNVIFFFYK